LLISFDGAVNAQPFTSEVLVKYVKFPEYGPYVNELATEVNILNVNDDRLKDGV